ncbi:MAG TPA: DUF6174 domain-containing protein [Gammaproteobacteria bacterium]|nr:DUF6174 domain-containing protein [Gammaproteobacteria bacterium]
MRRLGTWLRGVAVAGLLSTVLPGVVAAASQEQQELTAAKRSWQSTGLASYEYGYRKYCACHPDKPPETVVTVRGGSVVGVRHRPVGYDREVPAEARNLQYYWTVDGLFDLLAAAFDRGAQVRVAYDAARGFPTELHIDYDKNAIGDELDIELTQVVPLTGG